MEIASLALRVPCWLTAIRLLDISIGAKAAASKFALSPDAIDSLLDESEEYAALILLLEFDIFSISIFLSIPESHNTSLLARFILETLIRKYKY